MVSLLRIFDTTLDLSFGEPECSLDSRPIWLR